MRKSLPTGRTIDYEDVDDIIGVASELHDIDQSRLSVEELQEVAADLDIPTEFVVPAIEALRARRQNVLAAHTRKRKRRKVWAWSAFVLLVIGVFTLLVLQNGLQTRLAEAELARARVLSVLKHQKETKKVWEPRPDSSDRQAELDGAANRIRVEARRYDKAVTEYNQAVTRFPYTLASMLSSLPEKLPLSSEIDSW